MTGINRRAACLLRVGAIAAVLAGPIASGPSWAQTAPAPASPAPTVPAPAAPIASLVDRVNKGIVEIIAGGLDGTDLRIASDLATVLDDGATRRVLPVIGKGSVQNLIDIYALRGVDLGIVQSDVLTYAKARKLNLGVDGAITFITKLYNQEFHLLAGPAIKTVRDLEGKKVNFDVAGSGTAFTGPLLFQLLKLKVEPTQFDSALAIEKVKSGEIAAMAYVTGKPAALFTGLKGDGGLHFVPIPLQPEVLAEYLPSRIGPDDYAGLFAGGGGPVDTVAVGSVLAVANLTPDTERYRNVANFVDVFFTQFPKFLEAPRHPKWREVNLSADLPGWKRFPPAEAWLKKNAPAAAPVLSDVQLREAFAKFLDERARLSRGKPLTQQQKDEMFEQFQKWQSQAN